MTSRRDMELVQCVGLAALLLCTGQSLNKPHESATAFGFIAYIYKTESKRGRIKKDTLEMHQE